MTVSVWIIFTLDFFALLNLSDFRKILVVAQSFKFKRPFWLKQNGTQWKKLFQCSQDFFDNHLTQTQLIKASIQDSIFFSGRQWGSLLYSWPLWHLLPCLVNHMQVKIKLLHIRSRNERGGARRAPTTQVFILKINVLKYIGAVNSEKFCCWRPFSSDFGPWVTNLPSIFPTKQNVPTLDSC